MRDFQGGFKSERYLEVMDWVAANAAQTLAETGRITRRCSR